MKLMKTGFFVAVLVAALTIAAHGVAQAQGAQFIASPVTAILQSDPDGDTCFANLVPPTDDINDFIRINPNGESFLHVAEQPVAIQVTTPSGGGIFLGTGSMVLNVHNIFGGGKNNTFVFQVSGQVSDGTTTHQAICSFRANAKAVTIMNEVDLH